jgi:hypothetical protein
MTDHMKKAHVKQAMIGVIEPIARTEGFVYRIYTAVEHYPSIVELNIDTALDTRQVKRVQNAIFLIKTDMDMTIHDHNGFH